MVRTEPFARCVPRFERVHDGPQRTKIDCISDIDCTSSATSRSPARSQTRSIPAPVTSSSSDFIDYLPLTWFCEKDEIAAAAAAISFNLVERFDRSPMTSEVRSFIFISAPRLTTITHSIRPILAEIPFRFVYYSTYLQRRHFLVESSFHSLSYFKRWLYLAAPTCAPPTNSILLI